MNDNDAMLTGLKTAESGSTVENNAPNATNPGNFQLVLEGAAGNAVGNSGQPYTLSITAIDLTTVTPAAIAVTGNPLSQSFSTSGAGAVWVKNGTDFTTNQTFNISVPGGGGSGAPLTGHTLQYVATLVSQNDQIVSVIQSEPFVLV
jgi:hypothetical protein